tara:strand:+ start:1176 stop:1292 length:117 start_codon:yes stop_codon:yes gene_type:complete
MHGYTWFKAVEVIENKRPVAKIVALHHSPASRKPTTES